MAETANLPQQRQDDSLARFVGRRPFAPVVSVVVPTRNESGNVGPLVERLERVMPQHDMEIVFVDDSDDGTDAVVREMIPAENRDIVLLHREDGERTGGLGGAVAAGMRV